MGSRARCLRLRLICSRWPGRTRSGRLCAHGGRWRFASGIEWSSWIGVGGICVPPDGERPEYMLFFVPKKDLTIHDDWHTLGLRGTASRAVAVERKFVPEHRAFPLQRPAVERGAVVKDGPLWRMPFMTMQGLAILTPSVGVAQRMVDEFHAWTKQRVRPYEGIAAKEMPAPPAHPRLGCDPMGRGMDAGPALCTVWLGPRDQRGKTSC